MGVQATWRAHPRKFGPDSRACRVCNNTHGLIRKYHLNICRRCFREYANDIGFKKASVNKESVDAGIKAVKMRKARYALFKVTNEAGQPMQIVLDKQGDRKTSKEDFFKDLNDTQPRFAIYDYEFKTDDGRATSTLYFIYWAPQNSNQVDKILVSSAKANFVACLEGFKSVTCEKKKAVQELFENEVLSGR